MIARAPFTFGIPLIGRAAADDWPRVEALLELTLASVAAQTQPDFRVLVAGHDRPQTLPDDPRVEFLRVDWPVEAVRADNLDAGRKKFAINDRVRERGGGLQMFLDADDWVDARLIERARANIGERRVGAPLDDALVARFGLTLDRVRAIATNRCSPTGAWGRSAGER